MSHQWNNPVWGEHDINDAWRFVIGPASGNYYLEHVPCGDINRKKYEGVTLISEGSLLYCPICDVPVPKDVEMIFRLVSL